MGGAQSSRPAPSDPGRAGRRGAHRTLRLPSAPPWVRENLERSLPILVVGGFCVGLAAWLDAAHLHAFGSRLPLWTLVAAVGGTLVGGGSALTLVEEPSPLTEAGVPEGYVLIPTDEWARLNGLPGPTTIEAWDEESLPEPATPSIASPAETGPTRTVPVDPLAVAQASAELVARPTVRSAAAEPILPASEPPAPQPSQSASVFTPISPVPAPVRETTSPAPANVVEPSTVPPTPEFRDVLALLERAEASVRSRIAPPPLSEARDRCTGCGAPVSTYSEQVCVMCDRPLCDRCVDRTAEAGHPQLCDPCHARFAA